MDAKRVILIVSVVSALSVSILAACCPTALEIPAVSEPTVVQQEGPTVEPTEEGALPTEVPTDVPEPTEEVSPTESPTEAPVLADGEALLQDRCSVCHGLERTTGASKTREEWVVTVDRMIDKGAELTAEERDVLIVYLTEMHGE